MRFNDMSELHSYTTSLGLGKGGLDATIHIQVPILGYGRMHRDVGVYGYWRVDDSSFDGRIIEAWKNGEVVLNHAICPVTIRMDKRTFEKYLKHPQTRILSFNDYWKEENEVEKKMFDLSEKIEKSGALQPGFIYTEGVADGHAVYVVTKVNKASVVLEHRHFGDGYRAIWLSGGGKVPMNQFLRISKFGRQPLLARRESPWD